MATPNIRFSSSISDPFRIYQRAIELLQSTAPESENDLLELCKKFQTEPQAATKPMSKKARILQGAGVTVTSWPSENGPAGALSKPTSSGSGANRGSSVKTGRNPSSGSGSRSDPSGKAEPPKQTPISSKVSGSAPPVPALIRLGGSGKGGAKPSAKLGGLAEVEGREKGLKRRGT